MKPAEHICECGQARSAAVHGEVAGAHAFKRRKININVPASRRFGNRAGQKTARREAKRAAAKVEREHMVTERELLGLPPTPTKAERKRRRREARSS